MAVDKHGENEQVREKHARGGRPPTGGTRGEITPGKQLQRRRTSDAR